MIGIIELTNGLKSLSSIYTKNFSYIVVISSFLLGFGGFSVILQVLSITSKAGISIKPYIIGKFLQGCFASIYTFIILRFMPMFNLDLQPVFANISSPISISHSNYNIFAWLFLLVVIMCIGLKYRKN